LMGLPNVQRSRPEAKKVADIPTYHAKQDD
jgi:hypothetical protein